MASLDPILSSIQALEQLQLGITQTLETGVLPSVATAVPPATHTGGLFTESSNSKKSSKGEDDPLDVLKKAAKDIEDAIEDLMDEKVPEAFEEIINAAKDLHCIESGLASPCGHVFSAQCAGLAQAIMPLLMAFGGTQQSKSLVSSVTNVYTGLKGTTTATAATITSFTYDDVDEIYDISKDVLESFETLGCFELATTISTQVTQVTQVAVSQKATGVTPLPSSPIFPLCASLAQYAMSLSELIAGAGAQQTTACRSSSNAAFSF